jgi:hypothetical protein
VSQSLQIMRASPSGSDSLRGVLHPHPALDCRLVCDTRLARHHLENKIWEAAGALRYCALPRVERDPLGRFRATFSTACPKTEKC